MSGESEIPQHRVRYNSTLSARAYKPWTARARRKRCNERW